MSTGVGGSEASARRSWERRGVEFEGATVEEDGARVGHVRRLLENLKI